MDGKKYFQCSNLNVSTRRRGKLYKTFILGRLLLSKAQISANRLIENLDAENFIKINDLKIHKSV